MSKSINDYQYVQYSDGYNLSETTLLKVTRAYTLNDSGDEIAVFRGDGFRVICGALNQISLYMLKDGRISVPAVVLNDSNDTNIFEFFDINEDTMKREFDIACEKMRSRIFADK